MTWRRPAAGADRLPHAPGRRRRALRRRQLHARARRPLRDRGGRGRDRRDRLHRPRLPLRRGARLVRPRALAGRCGGRPGPLPRRRLGGARRRPAGEGRARGRLPARSRAADRRGGRAVSTGTTCWARCTGWPGWRWTGSWRRSGIDIRSTRSGASTARTSAWPRRAASTTRWPTPTWPRCSGSGRSGRRRCTARSPTPSRRPGSVPRCRRRGTTRRWTSSTRIRSCWRCCTSGACRSRWARTRTRRERVGRDFPRALAELHAAGYRTLTVFDRRERRQEVFDA